MGRITSQFEDELETVVNDDGPDRIANFQEYYQEAKTKRQLPRFNTGFPNFDSSMHGFRAGELTTITGPTGNGKTLFAESIGQRFMRLENQAIAWFSFEVAVDQMLDKYMAATDKDNLGLYVPMQLKSGDLPWLKRKCLEAQVKYGCSAVFIDHLHFLVDMNTNQNMSLNIGAVLRHIKLDIALGMGLMVFLIAHQGQLKKDDEPSVDNIRDSSFIGQESDNVIVVYRSPDPLPEELENNGKIKGYPRSYEGGYATVKIDKARFSGTYRKKLAFQKVGSWLEEMP